MATPDGRSASGHSFALISGWSLHVEPDSAQSGADARIKWGDRSCAAIRAKQPPVRAGAYWEMLKHPLQDEYWEARSMEAFIDRDSYVGGCRSACAWVSHVDE